MLMGFDSVERVFRLMGWVLTMIMLMMGRVVWYRDDDTVHWTI